MRVLGAIVLLLWGCDSGSSATDVGRIRDAAGPSRDAGIGGAGGTGGRRDAGSAGGSNLDGGIGQGGDARPEAGGSGGGSPLDAGALSDSTRSDSTLSDAALSDSTLSDAALSIFDAALSDAAPDAAPPDLSRGLRWVRAHPMFISGLTVQMGPPPVEAVRAYFDDFHASAVHLWAAGLPRAMDGWRGAGRGDVPFVSWVMQDGGSADGRLVIGGYPANVPGRIGFQIGDEPLTMEDLIALGQGAAAVRRADPEGLIILNLSFLADELLGDFLAYFADEIQGDVISYDRYTRSDRAYETLAIFRAAGLRHGLPYWRYLNAYEDTGESDWWSESDMRWDAFVGLLYGYTGHTWFLYQIVEGHNLIPAFFAAPADLASPRTPRFGFAAQINQELAHLGRAITQLTSAGVRYVPGGIFTPRGIEIWAPGAGGDPYLTAIETVRGGIIQDYVVGLFTDDRGERYLMVQNANHDGAHFGINNHVEARVRLTFDFDRAPRPDLDPAALLVLRKATGEVEHLPLQAGAAGASVEITLAAGDPILLKYKTARPFALR